MCRPASFIVTRDAVLWSKTSDSHDRILQENKLSDLSTKPDFVRVEVYPKSGDFREPIDTWVFHLDQDLLPVWFDQVDVELRARRALVDWYAQKMHLEGSFELWGEENGWFYGNATATLRERAIATL
jgi:hypothetical protein